MTNSVECMFSLQKSWNYLKQEFSQIVELKYLGRVRISIDSSTPECRRRWRRTRVRTAATRRRAGRVRWLRGRVRVPVLQVRRWTRAASVESASPSTRGVQPFGRRSWSSTGSRTSRGSSSTSPRSSLSSTILHLVCKYSFRFTCGCWGLIQSLTSHGEIKPLLIYLANIKGTFTLRMENASNYFRVWWDWKSSLKSGQISGIFL